MLLELVCLFRSMVLYIIWRIEQGGRGGKEQKSKKVGIREFKTNTSNSRGISLIVVT